MGKDNEEDARSSGHSFVHVEYPKSRNSRVLADIFNRIIVFSSWQPGIPTAATLKSSLPNLPNVPSITLDYGVHGERPKIYNETKVALLIENRPNPILAPLLLHFMSVVPPDWRFRFMGSIESVHSINQSLAIRNQVAIGKLDLTYIPANMSTAGQEMISRFLTNLWLYETVLQPAEFLLVFQTDSMLCANARDSINNWLEYDWVGAPWNPQGQGGGNGGLSLRKVSSIIDVLHKQTRADNSEPEDVWLSVRLGARPNANLANGSLEIQFSGEMHGGPVEKVWDGKGPKDAFDHGYVKGVDDWRDGFYEPMGYHTGGSGDTLHGPIWGTPAMRKHIWDYCPEMKMTLKMDAAYYVLGNCNSNWKRDGSIIGGNELCEKGDDWEDYIYRRGFDEDGYPYLPANLVPW